MEKGFTVKYRDKILFPIIILIMNTIDLYIVYPEFLLTKRFLLALAEDTVVVMICWIAMRQVILALDKKYPYYHGFKRRIAIQLPLTILVSCGLLLGLTALINWVRTDKPVPRVVYTHHIWVYAIWLLGHNGIYITLYFLQWSKFLQTNKQEKAMQKEALLLKVGNKSTVLNFSAIRYCTVGSNLTLIVTVENEFQFSEKSLEELEELLPPELFFRANRQYIIHRDLVQSIEKIEHGKITVLLKAFPKLPPTVSISRIKAAAFKQWLKQAAV